MSLVPIGVLAEKLQVVVAGGGVVASRKATQFIEAGARVTVIAPHFTSELQSLSMQNERLILIERAYEGAIDLDAADLVVAATDSAEINAIVCADAASLHRIVNVADSGSSGSFVAMAAHSKGPLTVGVATGSTPGAAARIRDAIASRFDERYSNALTASSAIRSRLIADNRNDDWRAISREMFSDDFCSRVEEGTFKLIGA